MRWLASGAGRAWGGAGLRVSGAREFGPARGWAKGERGAWAAAGERKGPVGLGRGVGAAQSEKREVRAEGVGRARAEGGLVG